MKNVIDRVHAGVAPRNFAQRSLASHLSTVFAIEPEPLKHAADEARARLAATPNEELRALAVRPRAERASLMTVEPMGSSGTPAKTKAQNVALIPIIGTIVAGDASCARFMGIDATGLDEISAAFDEAAADESVAEIHIAIDSPGGTAVGVHEVGNKLAQVAATKPVRTYIGSMCASAAYWLIAKSTEIIASPTSMVGSIGVYSVIVDSSAAAKAEGIKVHVLRSGEHKGAGVPGTEVSDKHLAAHQERVDDLAAFFFADVAAGRPLAEVKNVATGEYWIASKALERGLIDSVATTQIVGGNTSPKAIAREGGEPAASAANVQEDSMSKDADSALAAQMAAVKAELEAANKANAELAMRNEKTAATLKSFEDAAAKRDQEAREAAIERHAKLGTFAPAERASIVELSEKFKGDAAGFEAHLDTRAKFQGSVVNKTPVGSTTDQKADAGQPDDIDTMEGVGADGKIVKADGKRVDKL